MEKRIATVEYWEGNARWYDLWIRHNNYHEEIIRILTDMAEPGWRVLDIGGGAGVLSLPLAGKGCCVTIIEPSRAMRSLLYRCAGYEGESDRITVDERRWEDVRPSEFYDFDLIMACNSLHLTGIGFEESVHRIFRAEPKRTLIVTEEPVAPAGMRAPSAGYRLSFLKSYETKSSYAYHSIDEAYEHLAFRLGRPPGPEELTNLGANLVSSHGHLRLLDTATIHIYCWKKEI